MLDDARHKAGVSFVITSGVRCSSHNRAVGGKKSSSHLKGLAADISCQMNAHGVISWAHFMTRDSTA